MMYLFLLIGFVLLIKGADLFVEGASSAAALLKVPSVVIGLTIVAMGTSAPEASVSITAAISGSNSISLGNVIGSNIFNLLMVIGISAIVCPIVTPGEIVKRDLKWNLAVTAALILFLADGMLGRWEGVCLLLGMTAYLILLVRNALGNRSEETQQGKHSPFVSAVLILIGLGAVIFGGNLVVENASKVAAVFGMSETLIGLTIVAVGTSLPELVTSITAARKGDSGIALGNAVGSGLFNIMFILGSASVISPLCSDHALLIDTMILFGVGILLYIFIRSRRETSRAEGAVCVCIYLLYTAYIILRH